MSRLAIAAFLCVLWASGLFGQSRAEHRVRWSPVPAAIGYQLQVRSAGGRIVLDVRTQGTAFEFSVDEGPHFLRLGALNKFGETGSWTAWSPLGGGRVVEDPRAVAERKRKADMAGKKEAAASKKAEAVAQEHKREREKTVAVIKREIRERVEEATGEFTLSGDAVIQGTIIESDEDSVVIRGGHGVLRVRRADIAEARVYAGGIEKIVPARDLRGVSARQSKKDEPRLSSGADLQGRAHVVGGQLVLDTRVGRIPLRSGDLAHGPKGPPVPPGPELKRGEYGIVRLRGGGEILGIVVLRSEHMLVMRTGSGQIEVNPQQVLYTRPAPPPQKNVFARLRGWLGF